MTSANKLHYPHDEEAKNSPLSIPAKLLCEFIEVHLINYKKTTKMQTGCIMKQN